MRPVLCRDEAIGYACDFIVVIELKKEHKINVFAVHVDIIPADTIHKILKGITEHG
jgi:hypothetical protein